MFKIGFYGPRVLFQLLHEQCSMGGSDWSCKVRWVHINATHWPWFCKKGNKKADSSYQFDSACDVQILLQ
jgi:hypothetical protein